MHVLRNSLLDLFVACMCDYDVILSLKCTNNDFMTGIVCACHEIIAFIKKYISFLTT